MRIEVNLSADNRVEAQVGKHLVTTDQAPSYGGKDTAPAPFDLFLASLATCTAYYALGFCQARDIDPTGLSLNLETYSDAEGKSLERVEMELVLPPGFPEKYRKAVLRVANMCAVKKVILNPPEMTLTARPA